MKNLIAILLVLTVVCTGCEQTKKVAEKTKDVAVSAGKFAKKRIPVVRELLEIAVLAYQALGEISSGAEWKTAVADAFCGFLGSDPENNLEEKLDGMTDHEIDQFYEQNKSLLDPLIENHSSAD